MPLSPSKINVWQLSFRNTTAAAITNRGWGADGD